MPSIAALQMMSAEIPNGDGAGTFVETDSKRDTKPACTCPANS